MTAAIANKVKKVILLSTDKAVYPDQCHGNVKGPDGKELWSLNLDFKMKGDTVFCATRYGNVMASRGSVIPLFISQIKNDEPITITDPTMTRFL